MNKPDIVTRLREWYWYPSKTAHEAAAEIVRLRAERDEARRMYCGRVSRDVQPDAFDIAKNHGWDCFPQEDDK